jgi:hypothetical protein
VLLSALSFTALLAIGGCVSSNSDSKEFASLAGVWTGKQESPAYAAREITITIRANGSYTWTRGGAFVTDGQLTRAPGASAMGYANTAGSRGEVTASGRQLVWKNTLTGNNYTVTVSR